MYNIQIEPVLSITIGLVFVTLLVLVLPFISKKVEENLEPFFLLMGIMAVTISGAWSHDLIIEALKAPVTISNVPIGIFQVVLLFGLIIHFYNQQFCRIITRFASIAGWRIFVFTIILVLSLIASIFSVIVVAVLLAEILALLPLDQKEKVKFSVIACFAMGLGAVLTPVGEPLSTIMVSKLSGEPYHADFFFPFHIFSMYVIPGIIILSLLAAFVVKCTGNIKEHKTVSLYSESIKSIILRAVRIYIFVMALVLLGDGLKPLVIWYLSQVPSWALYWINILSAILDNATLTAVEIDPAMSMMQIKCIIMGLLIAGGMLIPGNIPNIVTAARLRISMKEWAIAGIPLGLILMTAYFLVLLPQF